MEEHPLWGLNIEKKETWGLMIMEQSVLLKNVNIMINNLGLYN